MALSEEEVYNGTKRWLRKNGFIILAGQPARGVDHLPVIEIKKPSGDKGSKDAYKPDLLAYKDNLFYIIECKPLFNQGDLDKIKSVFDSKERSISLYNELEQYHLFEKIGYSKPYSDFAFSIRGVLSFSEIIDFDCDLYTLCIHDWKGSGEWK